MVDTIILLGSIAGALAAIWGTVALAGKLFRTLGAWGKKRREKREAPMQEMIKQMRETGRQIEKINERLGQMEEVSKRMAAATEELTKNVKRLDDSVGTLQGDRLNQAFDYYVDKKNPCPLVLKASLTAMCEQYQNGGHNHLAENYIERIQECPTN